MNSINHPHLPPRRNVKGKVYSRYAPARAWGPTPESDIPELTREQMLTREGEAIARVEARESLPIEWQKGDGTRFIPRPPSVDHLIDADKPPSYRTEGKDVSAVNRTLKALGIDLWHSVPHVPVPPPPVRKPTGPIRGWQPWLPLPTQGVPYSPLWPKAYDWRTRRPLPGFAISPVSFNEPLPAVSAMKPLDLDTIVKRGLNRKRRQFTVEEE